MGIGDAGQPALSSPEPLADAHDFSAFSCGEPVLDDWLRKRARANQLSGASRTYVLCRQRIVIGYYSLASGAIAIGEAPSRLRRNMPDPIPMTVLGRFAMDRTCQGQGLGKFLLRDAILRTQQAAAIIGVRGLLVHALTPAAKTFYAHYGFQETPLDPMTLVLSLMDTR